MTNKEEITFSEISTWQTCRMKHLFSYVKKLVPTANQNNYGAREFGSTVHKCFEDIHRGELHIDQIRCRIQSGFEERLDMIDPIDEKTRVRQLKYLGLILAYIELPKVSNFIEVEKVFSIPIKSLKGYSHRKYKLAGKIDGVLWENGGYHLYELKTTGRFGAGYVDALRLSWQHQAYGYAAEQIFGKQITGIVHEIINTQCNLRLKKGQSEADYVSEVQQYVIDRPDKYRIVLRDFFIPDTDMPDFKEFLWGMACEIRDARNIYRNPSQLNCSICDFVYECQTGDLSLCETRERKHVELSKP